MKNLTLTTLLIIITLGFSSCTQDDSAFLEDTSSENLLKSFNISKSKSGEYSLDYQINNGAASDNLLDDKTNTNNIYLYSSAVEQGQSRKSDQELIILDGQLKVRFEDTENDKKYTITISDDDIETSKTNDSEFLDSYGISGNGDGSYDLNFKVKDGVSVELLYNGDLGIYEVHLREDVNASELTFSQTYRKKEGVSLKIDFVNHSSAKSTITRKPRGTIDD